MWFLNYFSIDVPAELEKDAHADFLCLHCSPNAVGDNTWAYFFWLTTLRGISRGISFNRSEKLRGFGCPYFTWPARISSNVGRTKLHSEWYHIFPNQTAKPLLFFFCSGRVINRWPFSILSKRVHVQYIKNK